MDNYDKYVEHERAQAKQEESIVTYCKDCDGPIFKGDKYYRVSNKDYCAECIRDSQVHTYND